VQIIPIT
jgi:transposase InsO family protein